MLNYLWFKYDLARSITHPKFDTTRVWTHDIQIMNSTLQDNYGGNFYIYLFVCHIFIYVIIGVHLLHWLAYLSKIWKFVHSTSDFKTEQAQVFIVLYTLQK